SRYTDAPAPRERNDRMMCWMVAATLVAPGGPRFAPGDDALRDELERLGWEQCEKQHVPGVGVALVRDGALAWAIGCGWADVEAEREVTGDTVFNIGSI